MTNLAINGMDRAIRNYTIDGVDIRTVTSQFKKDHPIYKKYGVRSIETTYCSDGRLSYGVSGDTFASERKFRFSVGSGSSSNPRLETANFLEALKQVRNHKIPQSMQGVVDVAMHLIK